MSRLAFPFGPTAAGPVGRRRLRQRRPRAPDAGAADLHGARRAGHAPRARQPGAADGLRPAGRTRVASRSRPRCRRPIQQWLGHVLTLVDLTVTVLDEDAALEVAVTYEAVRTRTTGHAATAQGPDMSDPLRLLRRAPPRAAGGPDRASRTSPASTTSRSAQGNPVSLPTEHRRRAGQAAPPAGRAAHGRNIRLTGGVRFPAPVGRPGRATRCPGAGSVSTYRVTDPRRSADRLLHLPAEHRRRTGHRRPAAHSSTRACPPSTSASRSTAAASSTARTNRRAPAAWSGDDPTFDYRARDWEGFRRLMLDRLAVLVPGFREDDPVDLTTTVVEALAYRLDQQSYRLDCDLHGGVPRHRAQPHLARTPRAAGRLPPGRGGQRTRLREPGLPGAAGASSRTASSFPPAPPCSRARRVSRPS